MKQNWLIRDRAFNWGTRTYLMGILNVTPDSFSDGGEFNTLTSAIQQTQQMINAGADIIDIGGQSTRPGAAQISVAEELERVIPIITAIRNQFPIPISVDTTRAEVAKAAVVAGADIINDISGGTFDPDMFSTVAALGVPIILMHIRGTPETMQSLTNYDDLIGEICDFLDQQIQLATDAGINHHHIVIDPGIGFAKTPEQNLEILRKLAEFQRWNCPLLIGVSRKSFIGKILRQSDPKARIWGTAAACCAAISTGADILRVHDVPQMHDVCAVADAIYRNRQSL